MYRGTSLIRKRTPLEPYTRTMPRDLWRSCGVVTTFSYDLGTPACVHCKCVSLMSEVPLYVSQASVAWQDAGGVAHARTALKSSFSIALICTTIRQIPASVNRNQGPKKTQYVPARQGSTSLQRGGKSSFPIALICTTIRRIPASASTNRGPEKRDVVPLDRARTRRRGNTTSSSRSSTRKALQGYLAHKKPRPPRTLLYD